MFAILQFRHILDQFSSIGVYAENDDVQDEKCSIDHKMHCARMGYNFYMVENEIA